MLNPTWLRIFRDTFISILVFVNENCSLCKCFTEFYFFHWMLVASLAFKIALLVVISRTWTSLAGVLKLPRVSNAFKDYTRLHIVKPLNEELKLQILYYVVQTSNSSHCKLGACQRLYRWFWKFFNVFSENPFFALLAT